MIEEYKNLGHAIVEQALEDYKRNPNMRVEVRRKDSTFWTIDWW